VLGGEVMKNFFCLVSCLMLGAFALGCSGKDEAPPPAPKEEEGPCADGPDFRLNMEAIGDEGAVKGVLIAASPAPPERNENDWTVEFRDMSDAPLSDVEITMAQPFMPAHNHDGTFDPTVVALDEPGRFEIQDINLWMPGMWEVRFTVESASAGADYVVFDACIPE
jgi:hypothetical protein